MVDNKAKIVDERGRNLMSGRALPSHLVALQVILGYQVSCRPSDIEVIEDIEDIGQVILTFHIDNGIERQDFFSRYSEEQTGS